MHRAWQRSLALNGQKPCGCSHGHEITTQLRRFGRQVGTNAQDDKGWNSTEGLAYRGFDDVMPNQHAWF